MGKGGGQRAFVADVRGEDGQRREGVHRGDEQAVLAEWWVETEDGLCSGAECRCRS